MYYVRAYVVGDFYFPPKAGKYINGVVCLSVSVSVSVSQELWKLSESMEIWEKYRVQRLSLVNSDTYKNFSTFSKFEKNLVSRD